MATKTQRHKRMDMGFAPLSQREQEMAKQIVDAAYTVRRRLEPGLLGESSCRLRAFVSSWPKGRPSAHFITHLLGANHVFSAH
jgi:hypothetical protein